MTPAGDGAFFLVGVSATKPPALILVKVDSAGEELSRHIRNLDPGSIIASAASTLDGGCVVLGCTGDWALKRQIYSS